MPAAVADHTIVAVSAGLEQAMALTEDGQVFSWGDDTYASPEVPDDLQGRTIRAIASGYDGQQLVVTDGWFDPAAVTVSGIAMFGHTLSAVPSASPTPDSTDLEWLRDGSTPVGRGSTYTVSRADVGHRLSVRATFHRAQYDDRTVSSAPTGSVVMPAARFVVRTDKTRVRRGHTVTVTGSGLLGSEHYAIKIAGRTAATGRASSRGFVQRRVSVPHATAPGLRRVVVIGAQTNRWGARTLRVRR